MTTEPSIPRDLETQLGKVARLYGIDLLEDIIAQAEDAKQTECERIAEKLASFLRTLRPMRRPQMVVNSASRVDARRTLRGVIRHGGRLLQVVYHERAKIRRLIALLDASGSARHRGLAVLACALQRADPQVVVLAFDTEAYPVLRGSVESVYRQMKARCRAARESSRRFLSLADFQLILRQAGRLSPNASQSYLMIVSDLFTETGVEPDLPLSHVRATLRRYRRCWVVDAWPPGPPFSETPDGTMTCTARGLAELLEQATPNSLPRNLAWLHAETDDNYEIVMNRLLRSAQKGDSVWLRARRFTPRLKELGFTTQNPHAAQIACVARGTPANFGMIFHEATPV